MTIMIANSPSSTEASWLTKRFQRLTTEPEPGDGFPLSLSDSMAARVRREVGPRPTGELSAATAEEVATRAADQIAELGAGAVSAQARFDRDSVMQLLR